MRLNAAIRGDLKRIVATEKRIAAQGVTRGINRAGAGLQNELRRQVRRAGLGVNLEKAWRRERYPRHGNSAGAATLVYSGADRIHLAFTADRVIRARNGLWLAIPLEAAIAHGWHKSHARSRGSQARNWANIEAAERALGRLNLVPLDRNRALLIHDGTPYFLLTRQVRLRRRLDIEGPTRKWADRVPRYIVSELERAARRAGVE